MHSSNGSSSTTTSANEDDLLGYKDHPYEGKPFLWNLRGSKSSKRMTITTLLRNMRSLLGRKLNLHNALTLLLLIGVLLTYINLSHLHDLIIHHKSNCAHTKSNSSEFIQKRKFALHGHRLESGYLKHVVEVLGAVGWTRTTVEAGNWDLLWAHDYPFRVLKDELTSSSTLSKHKRVNHFPGSGYITNKMSLATSSLPNVPKAFQLPKEKDALLKYAKDKPHKRFVQKSNNHRGIRISKLDTLDFSSINASFVQEYISNPLLVDGHKFDIGVYTILSSISPLRVHIYSDVLFRFCPEVYHPFDPDVLDKYVVGDDYLPLWKVEGLSHYYSELGLGMKASFDAWYKKTKEKSPSRIWAQVESAIRAVYLAKEASILKTTTEYGGSSHGRDYFEMVRFDFVIDDDGQVFIMEANMSPNLSSAHFPPNQELYRQVLYNLFKLVGIATSEPTGRSTTDTTQVSRKHLAVFEEECASTKCLYDCDNLRCSLCAHCLNVESNDSLARAYLEQVNRGDTVRIFPPSNQSGLLEIYDTSTLNKENARQVEWFKGKCAVDYAFC